MAIAEQFVEFSSHHKQLQQTLCTPQVFVSRYTPPHLSPLKISFGIRASVHRQKSAKHHIMLEQNEHLYPASSVFGLILTTLHPPPSSLATSYFTFRTLLQTALHQAGVPASEYTLYSTNALHCTIATFHPFTTPPPPNPQAAISAWSTLVDAAIRSPRFGAAIASTPISYVRVKQAKVFDDGVGVLLYDDSDAIISTLRDALRDLQMSKQFTPDSEINVAHMKIPNIYHSTVLRWHHSPTISTADLQTMFNMAYEKAFVHTSLSLSTVKLMRESQPYMQQHTCCKTVKLFETLPESTGVQRDT